MYKMNPREKKEGYRKGLLWQATTGEKKKKMFFSYATVT